MFLEHSRNYIFVVLQWNLLITYRKHFWMFSERSILAGEHPRGLSTGAAGRLNTQSEMAQVQQILKLQSEDVFSWLAGQMTQVLRYFTQQSEECKTWQLLF